MTRRLRALFVVAVFCGALTRAWAAGPPRIRITIDDTAVRQLLTLAAAKDSSDASVDKWLDLPANQYLLRVGAQEQNLTREQLKANAVAVINGTATAQTQPHDSMGCLLLSPPADYTAMLADLRATAPARVARIAARDAAFSPAGTDVTETVYLHLGGDWDAVNAQGAIYVNIHFWHDDYRPGWDGFNMIVAHETMHTVQNAVYGNPEVQDNADGAFLTALSKLQREGIARYVEYDTDPEPYRPYTYGFYYRAVDSERLRAFPQDIALLQRLYEACYPAFDHDKFVDAYSAGVNDGGPYYDIGHGMAKVIDEKLGRAALIQTMVRGPKDFFRQYMGLCVKDHTLPLVPPDVARQVGRMPEKL